MDMYQKREQRRKLKLEDKSNEESSKMNINWAIRTYGNTHSNLYK